jgi:hypothetical protein
MVLLQLVDGKKGPGDILILLTCYSEPLTFTEWLFIGKCMLDSEASYYPISGGNRGPCLLLEALIELSHGVKFDDVIQRYGLAPKNSKLVIEDKRKVKKVGQPEYLHELL